MDLQLLLGLVAIALLAGAGVTLNRVTSARPPRPRDGATGGSSTARARQAVYPCQACGILTHELTRVRERQTGKVLGIYCRACGEITRG